MIWRTHFLPHGYPTRWIHEKDFSFEFLPTHLLPATALKGSVHHQGLLPMLDFSDVPEFEPLFKVREQAFQVLEAGRKSGVFTNNSSVWLYLRSNLSLPLEQAREFPDVSDPHIEEGEFEATVEASPLDKCPRCWNHLPDVDPVCPRSRDA